MNNKCRVKYVDRYLKLKTLWDQFEHTQTIISFASYGVRVYNHENVDTREHEVHT